MVAAAKGYRVIGAAAVIRKDGHERYVPKGGVFAADQLDEDNAKHLLSVALIEAAKVAPAEKHAGATITQADVDAAVKAAEDAKAAELEEALAALDAKGKELEAAKAELEQKNMPASRATAAKQS